MITAETYDLLCTPELRSAIRENIGRDPIAVALDRHLPHASLVATQVKYLTRAITKLPSYAAAQCTLPPRAFEQASSEVCAAHKRIEGGTVLDLTCGLGVDARALASRFDRVVTLERDPLLARITADNMRLMGISNVEVICTSAEEYLASTNQHFDWIYADPDRRDETGKKLVRLEDCSPNIIALRPLIVGAGGGLCLKNSPLFDVDAAFAIFPNCEVEVVSLGGECKEVIVYADTRKPRITATALGLGSYSSLRSEIDNIPSTTPFEPNNYRFLVIPDVAIQKGRVACAALREQALMWSNDGYGFAAQRPQDAIGRVLAIERIEPYDPKALKRELRGQRVELLKREFPLSTAQIVAQTAIREGGTQRLAFTKIGGNFWTIRLE